MFGYLSLIIVNTEGKYQPKPCKCYAFLQPCRPICTAHWAMSMDSTWPSSELTTKSGLLRYSILHDFEP